ncbi:MAG: hypothetical protein K8U57_26445 [Planctomycetes bacterium]|nr:hypothetical protein [Planctomycetota bacterium]
MTRSPRVPFYRLHKPSGQAVVPVRHTWIVDWSRCVVTWTTRLRYFLYHHRFSPPLPPVTVAGGPKPTPKGKPKK